MQPEPIDPRPYVDGGAKAPPPTRPRARRLLPIPVTLGLLALAAGALLALGAVPALGSSGAPPSLPAFAAPAQAAPPLLDAGTALTQTVGAYTFVLRPVWNDVPGGGPHADANSVLLAYKLLDAQGRPVPVSRLAWPDAPDAALPRLTVAGTALPWLGAAAVPAVTSSAAAASGPVLAFDASALANPGPQPTFALTLSVPLRGSAANAPVASDAPAGSTLAGPFHFAFRLAFDPARRVAAAPQSATAGGVTVTLERVVVTRREARVVLRFPVAGANQTADWQPIVTLGGLSPAGAALRLEPLGAWLNNRAAVRGWLPDGTWAASLRGPAAFASTGPWKVTVSALAVSSATSRHFGGGPWAFAVTLPPATAAP